jgi:hypothetical protein
MQPPTAAYAIELAIGLAMTVAVAGFLISTTVNLLIASSSCGAKPARNRRARSGVK